MQREASLQHAGSVAGSLNGFYQDVDAELQVSTELAKTITTLLSSLILRNEKATDGPVGWCSVSEEGLVFSVQLANTMRASARLSRALFTVWKLSDEAGQTGSQGLGFGVNLGTLVECLRILGGRDENTLRISYNAVSCKLRLTLLEGDSVTECDLGTLDTVLTCTCTLHRSRAVRTGYVYQPPACSTYRRRRAACPRRGTLSTYVSASGVPCVPRTVAPQLGHGGDPACGRGGVHRAHRSRVHATQRGAARLSVQFRREKPKAEAADRPPALSKARRDPPRLSQNGAKQASPAPEDAPGGPKLRLASANQPPVPRWPPTPGLFSTQASSRRSWPS